MWAKFAFRVSTCFIYMNKVAAKARTPDNEPRPPKPTINTVAAITAGDDRAEELLDCGHVTSRSAPASNDNPTNIDSPLRAIQFLDEASALLFSKIIDNSCSMAVTQMVQPSKHYQTYLEMQKLKAIKSCHQKSIWPWAHQWYGHAHCSIRKHSSRTNT